MIKIKRKAFGVKKFKVLLNNKRYLMVNLFGVGVYVER